MIGQEFVGHVVECARLYRAHKATKFVSPKLVVRATQKLERGKVPKRGNVEIVLTIGRPNFVERRFIKACQKAGETFPVRKVQIKQPPKRKR